MSDPRWVAPLGPGPHVFATPSVPPSKSELARCLVLAALLEGETRVAPSSDARDVVALVDGLRALGVPVRDLGDDGWGIGTLDLADRSPREVDAGEGGAPARFLLALASRRAGPTVVRGSESLGRRPIEPLLAALRALGARAERLPGSGLAVRVSGPWRASSVEVEAGESSQFASALLLAAPPDGLTVRLRGEAVSRPYLELTLRALREAGAGVEAIDGGWLVRGSVRGPEALRAALDASCLTWPAALAALRGEVTIPTPDPAQPDAHFPRLLAAMGAEVVSTPAGLRVASAPLRSPSFYARDCPDLVPPLAVVAAVARGTTRVSGAPHLRAKESDRIALLVGALRAFGVVAMELPDGLVIQGVGDPAALPAARPAVGGDHRVAMACALLGRAGAGAWIETPQCVAKSWPGFWAWLEAPAAV